MTTIEQATSPIDDASARSAAIIAFGALLARDLHVLRLNLREFLPRTLLQPLLLVLLPHRIRRRRGCVPFQQLFW